MSADSFYQVCETPVHTWVVLFGHMSALDDPVLTFPAREFNDEDEADEWADSRCTEYGGVWGREITIREWDLYTRARTEMMSQLHGCR